MFVGHLAVGFAGKRFAPKTSLGTQLIAAQLPDVLWSIFLILGIEHARIVPGITAASPLELYDYPISHSLLMDFVWACLFAGAYFLVRRYRQGAWVVLVAVLSHWALDWLSHRPDLPLAAGSAERYGLGVWNSIPLTFAVEGGLWIAGIAIYLRATRANDRAGSFGFWPVVVLLTGIWIESISGPLPTSIKAVAFSNLGLVAVFAWGYWIDGHRPVRTE